MLYAQQVLINNNHKLLFTDKYDVLQFTSLESVTMVTCILINIKFGKMTSVTSITIKADPEFLSTWSGMNIAEQIILIFSLLTAYPEIRFLVLGFTDHVKIFSFCPFSSLCEG